MDPLNSPFGQKLQRLRIARGLSVRRLADLAHCDPGYLSRLENGHRRPSTKVADVLDAVLDARGTLSALATPQRGRDTRRRNLIQATVATAGALLTPAAPVNVAALDQVLFGHTHTEPVDLPRLRAAITTAHTHFTGVRYRQLAAILPDLIRAAEATRDAAPHHARGACDDLLARVYTLATRLAIKLHEDGVAWATADRAVRAATASGNPHTIAVAARNTCVVLRRSGHHAQAQQLITSAATRLKADTGLAAPEQRALYGRMLATAAYTAAIHDRRDDALTLAEEAATATAPGFTANKLTLYLVGIARKLGDYGHAVHHAQQVRIDQLGTPERRARYWEDAALSWMGRGRPEQAWQALCEAEREAPQEVLYRPWARQLTVDLLRTDVRGALPGLRRFAQRMRVDDAG